MMIKYIYFHKTERVYQSLIIIKRTIKERTSGRNEHKKKGKIREEMVNEEIGKNGIILKQ